MNKHLKSLLIAALITCSASFSFAGGPWLVYSMTANGESSLLFVNLGYDSGHQFSFSETDPDEEVWLRYTKANKRIYKLTYDSDSTSDVSTQNQWHRLSWGREGNTFALLYSQYEVLRSSGLSDHGVFFGTGSCVSWPNTGNSIGVTGKYPKAIAISLLRLDGGWKQGDPLTTGSRYVKKYSLSASLDVPLTKALNDSRGSLSTNLAAKNWVINYFVTKRGYTQSDDVNED